MMIMMMMMIIIIMMVMQLKIFKSRISSPGFDGGLQQQFLLAIFRTKVIFKTIFSGNGSQYGELINGNK